MIYIQHLGFFICYDFHNRDASIRREEALALLRQVKSEQLDLPSQHNNAINDEISLTMEERVTNAINAYEDALKDELNLRTIIPGVRIVAPNDAARREEDIVAAKQFLNWDIDQLVENNNDRQYMEDDDESKKTKLLMQSRRRFDGKDENISTDMSPSSSENVTMSNGAKVVLMTVALSQIALLFLLSIDPMTAGNIFNNISGNP